MKTYIKPNIYKRILRNEPLLINGSPIEKEGWGEFTKRNKKIIEDAEYLSEDVSFEKEGIDSEL